MTYARLTPNERNGIYIAMVVINAIAVATTQLTALPPAYAQALGMLSLVSFSLMKQFGSDASPFPKDGGAQ